MAKEVKTGEFGVLEVLSDDGSSKVHFLQPGTFTIGSIITAKIRLKKARDVQCIVDVHSNGVTTLTPQTVFHPTRLNGKVLGINKAALLKPGDMFIVADAKIVYKNDLLTEQELQQKGKSVCPRKIFNTPLRRMTAYKQSSITNSTKKKSTSLISRNTPVRRKSSSTSSLSENVSNLWRARPVPESMIPSERNISGDPIKEDVDVNSPVSGSSFRRKVSKSGPTTPIVRGLKRISSTLSIDSGDSEKRLTRKSASLMKPDVTKIIAFDTVASNTPKKTSDRLPERLSTEEVPDSPISDKEMVKTILHFSPHNQCVVMGEQPTQFTRTKSVSDLTALKSEKRSLVRNKSFAAVSNKKAETPKAATIFKTPTSARKKSSKFNILDKSREQPTPAPVTSRSRSLLTTSRQSADSAWEALTEDMEQALAVSPNVQSRRSRQSGKNLNTKYEYSEQIAVEANQHVVSSQRSLFVNTKNRISRRRSTASKQPENTLKKFNRRASMENIKQAVSSPSASSSGIKRSRSMNKSPKNLLLLPRQFEKASVTSRSRSLLTTSRQSSDSAWEALTEDMEQALAVSPNAQSRRSRQSGKNLNTKYEDSEQIMQSQVSLHEDVARRSRSLTPERRQSKNDTFNKSVETNQHVVSSQRSLFVNTKNRISRSRSTASRQPENTPKKFKRRASMENIKQAVSSPSSSSSGIKRSRSMNKSPKNLLLLPRQFEKARGSKTPSTRNSLKNFASVSSSMVPNEDEGTETVLDSTFNTEGSGTWQTYSTGPRDDLSTLDSSVESPSFIDTTDSSSFVYQNSPTHLGSVELTESVVNVSGIEKLTKTPEQEEDSRSSLEYDRSYSAKIQKSMTPLITFSSTFNRDTSFGTEDDNDDDDDDIFDTTEGDSIVVEQTLKITTPENDVSPKQMAKPAKIQKSPKNDLRDVRGIKKIMATPKRMNSPENDLRNPPGFKQLFEVPKSPKNDLSDVRGVKRLLATPTIQNSPKNDLCDVRGVKRTMRTPKILKSPKNDLRDVRGIKGILKTPKARKSPRNDLRNPPEFKKLFELPKSAKSNLDDFEGIKELMATPIVLKASNSDRADVGGVKRTLKTPKLAKSPKNDLREPYGVKRLLATPKRMKSPKNDLSDVEDVDILMKTPNFPKSPKRLSKDVDSSVLGEILDAIQVTETDHHRQTILSSKRIRERAPKDDYTDVRGVKRMFAEEEARFKNVSNVSGVAELFNVSNTPTSSEAFTVLFNKKPLRTYHSKSPSPRQLNRSEINRTSADVSLTEPSVSTDVVNWVKTQQFVTNAVDSVCPISPNKDRGYLTPVVVLKRSKRLASRTPTPSKNVDSPAVRRIRSVTEKLVTSTPLAHELDFESSDASDKTNAKIIKKGILKVLVNSNTDSPAAGPKGTRNRKNLGEAAKENIIPDQSGSNIQIRQVTFDVEREETRRSKRTPRKPAKLAGFVSELPSKTVKNNEAPERNPQQLSSPDKEEPVVKQGRPKRGTKAAEKQTNETSEKPAPKKSRKKAKTVNEQADLSDTEESQTVVENDKVNKPTKRRRGKPVNVDENENSPAMVEEKPAKRLRGRRGIVDAKPEQFETKNDQKDKNLPTIVPKGKRNYTETADQSENDSEDSNVKDAEETRPVTRRGRKLHVSDNDSDCSVVKELEKPKPAKRGRPKKVVDQSANESEMNDTKEKKQITRRGQKRTNEEVVQPEVEVKKPVATRGRKRNVATEEDKSEAEEKPVGRRGRKQPVSSETEQLEKAVVELVADKAKAKVNAAKRGRKQAVKQQTVDEEELDVTSETLDTSDPTPLRRTTRRAAAKRVNYQDGGGPVPSNKVQQNGKRARKEIVEDGPIRKSARTRR